MARELRFRAWDNNQKSMYCSGTKVELGGYLQELGLPLFFAIALGNKSELMQSTGLKDKNGKEIYEGDIIKQQEDITYTKGKLYFRTPQFVKWHDGSFALFYGFSQEFHQNMNYRVEGKQFFDSQYFEVIGNIYENPELLKK